MRDIPIPMMTVTICSKGLCKQTFLWVGEWQKGHKNTHIKGHGTPGILLWLVTALLPTVHTWPVLFQSHRRKLACNLNVLEKGNKES